MGRINEFEGEYRFLSNFYPCKIEYQGIVYPSVEHGFQACKTFNTKERIRISKLLTAVAARQAGKNLELRTDWEEIKERVMRLFLEKKFTILELRQKLIATGDAELIENNWWNDKYWGVCNGVGKNRLGELLMEIRTERLEYERRKENSSSNT